MWVIITKTVRVFYYKLFVLQMNSLIHNVNFGEIIHV